jgi:hypothetical protein
MIKELTMTNKTIYKSKISTKIDGEIITREKDFEIKKDAIKYVDNFFDENKDSDYPYTGSTVEQVYVDGYLKAEAQVL